MRNCRSALLDHLEQSAQIRMQRLKDLAFMRRGESLECVDRGAKGCAVFIVRFSPDDVVELGDDAFPRVRQATPLTARYCRCRCR
jgi:hypothetical protein